MKYARPRVIPRFAPGPDPMESNQVVMSHECLTPNCDRFACTGSEAGFADYCCRACAETGKHGEHCDRNNPYAQSRIVPNGQAEWLDEYYDRLHTTSSYPRVFGR
jgi:hypothetical protein